jgi:hypothetical protein
VALQRSSLFFEKYTDASEVSRSVVSFDTYFPCVHGANTGELVKLHAFVAPQARSILKVTSPAIDEQNARIVIGSSRYSERDERSALGVIVSVSRTSFSGDSYELAIAIADKLARYASYSQQNPIIATGRLPHDGCGAVEAINHLHTKLRLVLESAQRGSCFLFPQANLDSATAEERRLLEELTRAGIRWHAVSHIDECMDFLYARGKYVATDSLLGAHALESGRHPLPGWQIAALLIPIVVLLLISFLLQTEGSPDRTTAPGFVASGDTDRSATESQVPETQQTQPTHPEQNNPQDMGLLESPYIDPAQY